MIYNLTFNPHSFYCTLLYIFQIYYNNPPPPRIHPPSSNLQRSHAPHSPPKVFYNYSAQPQLQQQRSRSPTSPGLVPQICVSPHDHFGGKLEHQSPELDNPTLRNCNSWNANMGHNCRRRSASPSPCRRGEQERNNLNYMRKMSNSQECFRKPGLIDLSVSAPEHSLRQHWEKREHRLYSVPNGNLLCAPQQLFLVPVYSLEEEGNTTRGRRCSSYQDLHSLNLETHMGSSHSSRRDLPHSKHTCTQDMKRASEVREKSKPWIIKAVIKRLGLSPRASLSTSPLSSRSPSPGSSPTPTTPYDSPFSTTTVWP